MIDSYTNEIGKSRPVDSNQTAESLTRKNWFNQFRTQLTSDYPELFSNVQIDIVGSVAKGQAAAHSDIDIVIRSKSSDELLLPKIRKAIYSSLDTLKEKGEPVYDIEIQDAGFPLLFTNLANLKRQKAPSQ